MALSEVSEKRVEQGGAALLVLGVVLLGLAVLVSALAPKNYSPVLVLIILFGAGICFVVGFCMIASMLCSHKPDVY